MPVYKERAVPRKPAKRADPTVGGALLAQAAAAVAFCSRTVRATGWSVTHAHVGLEVPPMAWTVRSCSARSHPRARWWRRPARASAGPFARRPSGASQRRGRAPSRQPRRCHRRAVPRLSLHLRESRSARRSPPWRTVRATRQCTRSGLRPGFVTASTSMPSSNQASVGPLALAGRVAPARLYRGADQPRLIAAALTCWAR